MAEYIEREAALSAQNKSMNLSECRKRLERIPAADVLPRDEAIRMGAELAAMHGSDATSQQLEEAYLEGVEYGMTRRDVRPVKRGRWELDSDPGEPWRYVCNICGEKTKDTVMGKPRANYCPNCGADMREES